MILTFFKVAIQQFVSYTFEDSLKTVIFFTVDFIYQTKYSKIWYFDVTKKKVEFELNCIVGWGKIDLLHQILRTFVFQ